MTRPITAQRIILLAVRIFSGSPPEVKNKKPAIIIIIGTMAIATQKIKLMIFSIHSGIVLQAKGLIKYLGGGGGGRLNVAVTLLLLFIAKVQVEEVPEQAPDQPAKTEPEAAVAVKVTEVPVVKEALQVVPQLIPEGLLVTVPEPVPAFETVNV